VNVRKAWRVRYDGVGNKRLLCLGIRLKARLPASVEDFCHHAPFSLNVTRTKAVHAWDQAWILDHVSHQVGGIATDGVKLELGGFAYKVPEDIVCCESDSMAMSLQFGAQRNKGLHIATTANHLYHDVKVNGPLGMWFLFILWRRITAIDAKLH
jgi:hypothetical protein